MEFHIGVKLKGVKRGDDSLTVLSAVDAGSSAEEQGLAVGDVVLSVNGTSVGAMEHDDVMQLLRNASAPVGLYVQRASEGRV